MKTKMATFLKYEDKIIKKNKQTNWENNRSETIPHNNSNKIKCLQLSLLSVLNIVHASFYAS